MPLLFVVLFAVLVNFPSALLAQENIRLFYTKVPVEYGVIGAASH